MEPTRRFKKWLGKELDDARQQAFQIIAALAALLLLVCLTVELVFKQTSDAKMVAALVASLLTTAFLACFGKEVAGRIKRIGPIEILEAHKAVRGLDAIGSEVVKALDLPIRLTLNLEKTELSPTQSFYYAEGDKLLTYLKLSGAEPESGAERDVFWELLFKVGRTAHTQLQWLSAIRWLEYLETLSEGDYRADEVSNFLAFSILFSSLQEQEKNGILRIRGLKKAVERFSKMAAKGELDYQGYFWLAYAQDELGQWYEAVRNNLEALKRRPRLAPSRYNLAISLLKLGKNSSAHRQLTNIRLQDEQIGMVTEGVGGDTEIRGLIDRVDNPEVRRQLLAELSRLNQRSGA